MSTFSELNKMANLISAIIGVDVGIINKDMIAIVGTGKYSKNIGTMRPRRSYGAQCIKTGEAYLVKHPTHDKYCYRCEAKNTCPFTMTIYRPIHFQNDIAGTIFFLSYTSQQRDSVLNKLSSIENYLDRLSSLAGEILFRKMSINVNEDISRCFESVVNEIEKPIIIADKDNRISYVNEYAERSLLCKSAEILNRELKYFLKQLNVSENICNKISKQSSQIYSVNPQKNKIKGQFNLYMKPVLFHGVYAGCVIRTDDCFPKKTYSYHKNNRDRDAFSDIIGNNASLCGVINRAWQAAKSNSNILLRGETGTGKGLVAQGIHEASSRCGKPFIVINCSALPDNLLESELFGYVDGAFTGAKRGGKIGKFELAEGGTLFLDEIGDLSFLLQAKLLRVLEDGFIEKLGSLLSKKVDVRIISATNRNLEDMVQKGTFRQDLYYRLNVIPISLPPLRDRKEDIVGLLKHFIEHFASKYGRTPKVISTEVEKFVYYYDWPGNIRELKNLAEYVMQDSTRDHIEIGDLPESLINIYNKRMQDKIEVISEENIHNLQSLEKKIIRETLTKYGLSLEAKKKVAAMLGISLTTLYRRISNYEMKSILIKDLHEATVPPPEGASKKG